MLIRFSWIISNRLAVGSFPQLDYEIGYLTKMGITSVLSLTEPKEINIPQPLKNQFVWRNVPIPDGAKGGVPKLEHFQEAYTILSRWQQRGHATYVHCFAGVGRSPSVCAAYLAKAEEIPLEDAIAKVQDRHPVAHPDSAQIAIMKQFLGS